MFKQSIFIAFGLAAALSGEAFAQTFGGHVEYENVNRVGDLEIIAGSAEVSGNIQGSLTIYAGSVEVDAEIGGDTHIAGGNVEVSGVTRGNAEIGGGSVDIAMDINGNADIGGGYVEFSGTIGGTLDAAAGRFEFTDESVVTRKLDIQGQELFLRGSFLGGVDAFAEDVVISGRFVGDVQVEARELTVLPGAVIEGRLIYDGPSEATISPDASITGGVEYTQRHVDLDWDRHHINPLDLDLDILPATPFFIGAGIAFDFLLGLIALVMMPRGVSRLSSKFRQRPLLSTLVGLFLFPMGWVMLLVAGIVLLAITIVGIILIPFWITFAVLVLMLAYPLGAIAVSDFIINRTGRRNPGFGMRVLGLLVILLVVAALWVVPPLAVIAGVILSWIGLGAWVFAAFGRKDETGSGAPAQTNGDTADAAI
ncbi:MAG: hypothetical protein DHS20C06_12650 [Hyphobacterium sp.]|nr:MAG: hypothetical protein DHS20C06_12650 [Hyphobacterium sp.]